MGRSTGVQVNAITKSGTNQLAGSFRANFRDDALNAENPVLGFVEPVQNQQYSTTLGGPMVRDKLHYFGNFEYEREPRTSIFNSPYPFVQHDPGRGEQPEEGRHPPRLPDLVPKTRLMGKFSKADDRRAVWCRATRDLPDRPGPTNEYNRERLVELTQVLNNSTRERDQGGAGGVRSSPTRTSRAGRTTGRSPTASPSDRRASRSRASRSRRTRTIRVTRTSGCGVRVTTSPTRTTRAAVTTCDSAASS